MHADSSSASHPLDTFSTSHTLLPLHDFCFVVSARHSSFRLQFDKQLQAAELLWPVGWGSLCLSPSSCWPWLQGLVPSFAPAELIRLTDH